MNFCLRPLLSLIYLLGNNLQLPALLYVLGKDGLTRRTVLNGTAPFFFIFFGRPVFLNVVRFFNKKMSH